MLEDVLQKHAIVFSEKMGVAKNIVAKIHVDPEATPKFYRPRSVPYAIKGKIEQELQRLENEGVVSKVVESEWAAPIVPVMKSDGSVRLCGDYKENQAIKSDSYPLPRTEDILASLAGGKAFTKLDIAHAYQQLPLDEDSKKVVTVNTHKGLYQFNRLPFGVSSAPSIFQRAIEGILQGLDHVSVYLDDILLTGTTEEEHLQLLQEVLSRLEEAGLHLKKSKCAFMLPRVEYLGYIISADGIQPSAEKVCALMKASRPENTTQLRSFLGLLNFYNKFLPQSSTWLAPLHQLLKQNAKWAWGKEQDLAFKKAQEASDVLVHYNQDLPLILECDASPYGVGAVLSHEMEDGSTKPVTFASRSLT